MSVLKENWRGLFEARLIFEADSVEAFGVSMAISAVAMRFRKVRALLALRTWSSLNFKLGMRLWRASMMRWQVAVFSE